MAREQEYQDLYDRIAALQATVTDRLGADLISNPGLGEAIKQKLDDLLKSVVDADLAQPPPPDKGLAELVGVGPEAAGEFGKTRVPQGIEPYDEQVTSERIVALGDLYYLYQHERIGVFKVVQKLQELFRNGTVRLSAGKGAFGLYQFDRREVLRYTRRDRLSAYLRAFGFGSAPIQPGGRPNSAFSNLFTHFVNQVTLYWRDKRISDVMRDRANDPSFGSIAVVRRAGLDLRNNLKDASYGHLNVLRVEVMQLLDEAFRILQTTDVQRLFGSENGWEVIEDVLRRYFNRDTVISPRQRMAIAGRKILRWLAQPHVLQQTRAEFEGLLVDIAEDAEEWLTSAQSLGLARRASQRRIMPWDTPGRATGTDGASRGTPTAAVEREDELELEV